MLEGFSSLSQTLLGTALTWFVTAVGASLCVLHGRDSKSGHQSFLLDGSLGFSAGVMLAASFWSLLDPAISMAKDDLEWGLVGIIPVVVGLVLGAAFVGSTSHFLPADWLPLESFGKKSCDGSSRSTLSSSAKLKAEWSDEAAVRLRKKASIVDTNEDVSVENGSPIRHDLSLMNSQLDVTAPQFSMNRRLWSLIIAVTVHNIPEGLAVGIAFGGIGQYAQSTLANARNLAIGIAIQNFPEGLAVSLPLYAAGCGFSKSFFFGQLSGLVEPLAGISGCLAVQFFRKLQPYALGFAAGAMLFVVFDDVIPEAHERGNGRWASVWAVVGFIVMMVLDISTSLD